MDGTILGVPPALLVVALFGVFLFTVGQALVARRILRLNLGFTRLAIAGFIGLAISGALMGPLFAKPGWQWPLIPLMWGLTLAGSMAAMILLDAMLPGGGGVVGLVVEIRTGVQRTRRYVQVSRIAAKHGLPRYVTGIFGNNSPERNAEFGRALRLTLEEAGAAFVKLGQVLSTRKDLLPIEVIAELSRLQDSVPPADPESVRAQLTADLGEDPDTYFAEFSGEPFAAASIAQVHRGTLQDGRLVAVKIRRPGVRAAVERDLDIVRRIALTLERRFAWAESIRASRLAGGFADSLREELDFRIEARNLTSVAAAAALHPGIRTARIPTVHAELTTPRLLVMEYLDGVPLGRAGEILARPGADRERVARNLLEIVLQQVMVDGIFHADPHPGNVLLRDDFSLVLLDFGAVGRLDSQLQGALQNLLLAVDQRDPAALRDGFLEIMERSDTVSGEDLERDLGRFMSLHLGPGLVPDVEMFTDMFRLVSRHGLAVPTEVATTFRALGTLEGTLASIAPGFNIVNESHDFIADALGAQLRPASLATTFRSEMISLLPLLKRLPRRVERITSDLEKGRFSVRLRLFSAEGDQRVIGGVMRRALFALVAATSGIMGAILLTSDGGPVVSDTLGLYDVLGYGFVILSTILTFVVLFSGARRHS